MLEKKDLKQIQKIVEGEIGSLHKDFKQDLRSTSSSLRQEFKQDIQVAIEPLNQRLGVLKEKTTSLQKDITIMKGDIAKIRRDISTLINFFDREDLRLRARVERIEVHLNLQPLPQEALVS